MNRVASSVRVLSLVIVAGCVAVLAAGPALALDPDPRKWASGFAGITLGQSKQRSYEFVPGTQTTQFEDTDTAYLAFGGYQALKYFAVAAAYVDLGTTRVAGIDPGDISYTDELKADGFNVMAMGLLPVAPKHSFFGYIGAFRWKQEVNYTETIGTPGARFGGTSTTSYHYDDAGTSPSVGIGYNWYVLENKLGIHVEYSRFFKVGEKDSGSEHQSDRDFASVGVVWSFR